MFIYYNLSYQDLFEATHILESHNTHGYMVRYGGYKIPKISKY
jgi:hypothetical protein